MTSHGWEEIQLGGYTCAKTDKTDIIALSYYNSLLSFAHNEVASPILSLKSYFVVMWQMTIKKYSHLHIPNHHLS